MSKYPTSYYFLVTDKENELIGKTDGHSFMEWMYYSTYVTRSYFPHLDTVRANHVVDETIPEELMDAEYPI